MIADKFQAQLIVLYAEPFEPPPYFTSDQEGDLVKSQARSRKAAVDYLVRHVKAQLGETFNGETVFMEDHPVAAILKTAESRTADWVVMGTQGRSGWSRARLESVAERVLRETEKPVLTVRGKEGEAKNHPASIRNILCPVNFTDIARKAMGYATTLAERFSAELRVLTVIESPGEVSEEEEKEKLCAWIPGSLHSRCRMQEAVRRGNAAEQILETAASDGCDLIVLGAQHKRFWDSTVLGTTTVNVTRHAPCPVFTVIQRS
jgi:nucleotide-binding universal stress UspA family protein